MTTQENLEPRDEKVSAENIPIVLAEYNNLRAEILKRIELRHQLISLALTAPAIIIALGFTNHNVFLILSYPILACFLSSVWIANTHGNHELAHYISKNIEPKLGKNNLGWQSHNLITPRPFRFLGILGSGAIFIATELLAIFAGVTVAEATPEKLTASEIALLILAILSVLFNVGMLVQLERKRIITKEIHKRI